MLCRVSRMVPYCMPLAGYHKHSDLDPGRRELSSSYHSCSAGPPSLGSGHHRSHAGPGSSLRSHVPVSHHTLASCCSHMVSAASVLGVNRVGINIVSSPMATLVNMLQDGNSSSNCWHRWYVVMVWGVRLGCGRHTSSVYHLALFTCRGHQSPSLGTSQVQLGELAVVGLAVVTVVSGPCVYNVGSGGSSTGAVVGRVTSGTMAGGSFECYHWGGHYHLLIVVGVCGGQLAVAAALALEGCQQ